MFQPKILLLAVVCFLASSMAFAKETLHVGMANSDGPPIILMTNNQVTGGLWKEIGQALAHELGTNATFSVFPRKRIEPLLEGGRIHITCNANPVWFTHPHQLNWTTEIYPQVERLISLASVPDIHQLRALKGKKISIIRGYSYPTVSYLWTSNHIHTEPRPEQMIRAVQKGLTDLAIVSELEFTYWAKLYPNEVKMLKVHPIIVTSRPTMCAVAKNSPVTAIQMNQAITRLQQKGRLSAILKSYSWAF